MFRYDGSSLFGENEKWAPYYRVSGAYRISEDFPTFDLPTNANSGKDPLGYCFEETAPVINSVLITFMDIFSKKAVFQTC